MSGAKPTHRAYVVEDRGEGESEEAFWTACGAAWQHKDGKGLNVQLAPGPAVSGRLVLRGYSAKDENREKREERN